MTALSPQVLQFLSGYGIAAVTHAEELGGGARLKRAGVIVSARPPRGIRLVTNRHHDDAAVAEAISRIKRTISQA